jgi:hypothetical protein
MVDYADIRLWANRVRLVKRHLASPGVFPGMSSSFADWYREGQDYWDGLAAHLDAEGKWPGGIDDEVAHLRFSRPRTRVPVEPGAAQGPMSAAERMRRYRERRAKGEGR